jgi:hypothetical protein
MRERIIRTFVPYRIAPGFYRRRLINAYQREIDLARIEKNYKKANELKADLRHELEMHDDEEDSILTTTLLAEARKLRVPVPSHSHDENEDMIEDINWRYSRHFGDWLLMPNGIEFVREAIRKERRARHEMRAAWLPWLAALTGLVGTITGLLAVVLQ